MAPNVQPPSGSPVDLQQPTVSTGTRLIILGAGAVGQAVLALLPQLPPPPPLSFPLEARVDAHDNGPDPECNDDDVDGVDSRSAPSTSSATGTTSTATACAAPAEGAASHTDFDQLNSLFGIDYSRVTVVDQRVHLAQIPIVKQAVEQGATFLNLVVTKLNYSNLLHRLASPGDIIVDVTTGIDCADVLGWCQENHVMYMNTAIEYWQEDADDPEEDWLADQLAAESASSSSSSTAAVKIKNDLYQRTLLYRQSRIRAMIKPEGPTAILDHGMNPGLVSHFAKDSLYSISSSILARAAGRKGSSTTSHSESSESSSSTLLMNPEIRERIDRLAEYHRNLDFGHMAQILGLRVIHINESDTQISKVPKQPGEFLCTWSVVGFHEEGIDPVQLGWGTHEKKLPSSAVLPPSNAEQHQIFLKQRGIRVQMRSHLPVAGDIVGSAIPHSEASTLTRFLSLPKRPISLMHRADQEHYDGESRRNMGTNEFQEEEEDHYRPSVYYVYDYPECAKQSWKECAENNYHLQPSWKVLDGAEIECGADMVGVLLMFEEDPVDRIFKSSESQSFVNSDSSDSNNSKKPWCYWHGSILDQQEAERIAGSHAGATTIQVAASLLSAVRWMMLNPRRGVCWPEDIDSAFILRNANPYLGQVGGAPLEWRDAPQDLQLADFIVEK